MNRKWFVATFGGMYEHSPWVAEAAFAQGPPDPADCDSLVAALRQEVEAAGAEAQLKLLRAHPDLAGKLALSGALTAESTAEQAGVGLHQCSPEQFERFQILNAAYLQKFKFPFIMAVAGSDRAQIIAAFEQRVEHGFDAEFATALEQVHRIAELRIQAWSAAQGEDK